MFGPDEKYSEEVCNAVCNIHSILRDLKISWRRWIIESKNIFGGSIHFRKESKWNTRPKM